ncbi:isoprenyl transferase [Rhizosphaericola mali]|uniref:Isoprenyl transferase n=1 Tax=Rhizosphaericola mali TaxID=2545455 RepID=A0A5P2GC12_9BACT|nr:isoprenyl transferase [Rhizosphaericola mali]QES90753.1 isoprenyl transferase [Rhizosphaericola mali]
MQQQDIFSKIDKKRLPHHVAIIMDGNGRWAKKQGKDRLFGHFSGVESVRSVTEGAAELGIECLTLYAFSTENWDRPQAEVEGLMALLIKTIHGEVPTLNKNNIRLFVIGDRSMLPTSVQEELQEALDKTAANKGLKLILALSYSSHWEIKEAVKKIAKQIQAGNLEIDDITDDVVAQNLDTSSFPNPELMIRTGGEHRISNFLLYQLAYAELYFCETQWPDYRKSHFFDAIVDFQRRERRFGKTSEQIQENLD